MKYKPRTVRKAGLELYSPPSFLAMQTYAPSSDLRMNLSLRLPGGITLSLVSPSMSIRVPFSFHST